MKPPSPREPTTTRSAPWDASSRARAGAPTTTWLSMPWGSPVVSTAASSSVTVRHAASSNTSGSMPPAVMTEPTATAAGSSHAWTTTR